MLLEKKQRGYVLFCLMCPRAECINKNIKAPNVNCQKIVISVKRVRWFVAAAAQGLPNGLVSF